MLPAPHLPAYVIHSPSLPERNGHIRHELDRAGIVFEWVEDFEIDDISPEIDARWFTPDADLTPGQKSCALKHIVAMERIRDRGQGLALIFEDDAQLVPNFCERLTTLIAEAERWPRPRILHLGAATNFYTPAAQLRPGQSLYEGDRVRNMEAYVLGAPEARARLDWIARNRLSVPIDIACNHSDRAMGIPFLWSEPPLAEQGSLTGRFKSSLERKPRSQLRLRFEFAIKKFKRRYLKRWINLG